MNVFKKSFDLRVNLLFLNHILKTPNIEILNKISCLRVLLHFSVFLQENLNN